MALSGSALSALIQTELAGKGFTGVQLTNFSNALGNGIVTATSGILLFTTADTGTIPGTGTGSGTGVLGLNMANISSLAFSTGQGFWASFQNNGPGIKWQDLCDAVATAVVAHFSAAATLTSTHSPVFAGTGIVTAYSGVSVPVMKAAIVAAAPGSWASWRMPELAEAIATGVVTELLTHASASTVTITGSPTGVPVPGAGTGSGVVT
jgi:hypothetical protein